MCPFRVLHIILGWPAATQIRAEKGGGGEEATARRGGGRRSRRGNQGRGRDPGTEDRAQGLEMFRIGIVGSKTNMSTIQSYRLYIFLLNPLGHEIVDLNQGQGVQDPMRGRTADGRGPTRGIGDLAQGRGGGRKTGEAGEEKMFGTKSHYNPLF